MMGRDDDTEDNSLDEATGYSLDNEDAKEVESEFLKCAPKETSEVGENEEKKEKNKHKTVKRIIHDEFSSQPSLLENNAISGAPNSQLIFSEVPDGSWKIQWDITTPESCEDFIALCWIGKI